MRSFGKNIIPGFLCVLLLSLNVNQGQTKEYIIKATLLEKFVNYIDWPFYEEPFFFIGIAGKSEFGKTLKKIYKETKFKNTKAEIFYINEDEDILPKILIVGDMSESEFKQLFDKIKKKPVLIVTDIEKYFLQEVHINFYISSKGNIRFKFNKKTFSYTGLYVSNLLLRYADFVE